MHLHPLLLLFASAIWLAGCQIAPTVPSTPGKDAATLTTWQADGRFAYRTPKDGGNASIHWVQQQQKGELTFSGPMGFGSAALHWHPTAATLTTSKGTINAPSPEALAQELTGIALPVEALIYWLRGLPWPHAEARITRQQEQLRTLKQLNWHIEYDRWQLVDGYWLPHRLKAKHGEDSFTVVVQNWALAR